MSQKKSKEIRKQSKQLVKNEFISSTYWLKRMPFWKRLKYAVKIIRGVEKYG